MWGRPGCLLKSTGGEASRILLASALSSMRIICPNKVSRRDWTIAVIRVASYVVVVSGMQLSKTALRHVSTTSSTEEPNLLLKQRHLMLP